MQYVFHVHLYLRKIKKNISFGLYMLHEKIQGYDGFLFIIFFLHLSFLHRLEARMTNYGWGKLVQGRYILKTFSILFTFLKINMWISYIQWIHNWLVFGNFMLGWAICYTQIILFSGPWIIPHKWQLFIRATGSVIIAAFIYFFMMIILQHFTPFSSLRNETRKEVRL